MNGDTVRYTEHPDDKGGTKAKMVWTRPQAEISRKRTEKIVAARKMANESVNRGKDSQAFWLTTLFVVALAISVFMKWMPQEVALVYLVASLITFAFYWLDKRAAQNGDRRTPENTLHFLSLAGGWPGALIAQRILRHKSVKGSFRVVFWVTALFNLLLLFVYLKKLA
ncbi:uncharacterized membrane protein YsdA (DUF1294 family) [Permianibacter aggregans]|uniref:Uncharacterized membrane protein YsdA (DUF1294 family) n=2 Tax=Permianibacter aggregans TaxID=1510150 RepID=A0A4R6UHM8_9GAMM|nr:uncharacterized membrane protein YsdA (DUF1294 family) [Permianibacter aggregans]